MKNFEIRQITPNDAESVIELMKLIDSQTDYLRYESGERNTTIQRIVELTQSQHEPMFVVVEGGKKLVGYLLVEGNTFKKKHHCIAIVLAIMEGYRGQGLGSKLIQYIEVWAKEQHIHRIELTVNTLNQSAFDLYTKLGFEIEGIKKHTTLIRGEYTDDYMMAKLI